jgi:hypothetical protein
VAVKRRPALPAASDFPGRGSVIEDLDLAGVAELPELRMFVGLRGDLSSLSGAEVQGLAAGQGTLSGFPVLLATVFVAVSSFVRAAERYFLPFPGIDGVWR